MKKKMSIAALTIMAMCTVAPSLAMAENAQGKTSYMGITYQAVSFEAAGYEADMGAITLKYGMSLSDMFGAELRFGFGINDDTIEGVDIEIDHYWGIYLKPKYEADGFQIYGLLGYASAELTASYGGDSVSADEDGLSYGLGFEWFFGNSMSANVEYMEIINDSDFDSPSFNIGLNYYF